MEGEVVIMTKILIIGGSGQLGNGLIKTYSKSEREDGEEKKRKKVIFTYFSTPMEGGIKLDLMDFTRVEDLILKLEPDVVINSSAYTDVDGCEVNKELAYKINAEAVKHIVRASRVIGSYLIHVSTDYVFDGEKGLYKEEDLPSPINYYGLTKLIGEAYVLSYDDSLLVRTSGVFGYKNNFPYYAKKSLEEGKEVYAWKDYYYSPIHADLLAEAISRLEEIRKTGIIHVSGERVSRYELALKIAEKLKVDRNMVKPSYPQNVKAKRPKDSSLDSSKAQSILGFDFYSLEANLNKLLSR